ncbi:MAG: hypothetical protein H0W68_10260 [Gemmatimonadaceae bacterium]|nr:hypothetical protein [Gemmatimonadaceae bacterium]
MTAPSRVGLIHLGLALFGIAIIGQTARVQLWQGHRWTANAERQQSIARAVPAPRGDIFDGRGELLAQSRETVKLEVAPGSIRDLRTLRAALKRAGVPVEFVRRATDPRRKWVAIPGRYLAIDVAAATAMRGVFTTPIIERAYAVSEGTRKIIGRVDPDGKAVDGVELALDSILRGTAGRATVMRDGRGGRFDSPTSPGTAPVAGHSVVLTINQELQEIAERALADAVSTMTADGGDVVVLDPRDGAILAMASQRANVVATASTALTEPYEPGSTLKPFIAAVLMEQGKARETDVVETYGGSFVVNGREITDEHKGDRFSLADVIRYSSNIGIVRFAERLTAREEFEALRDFGFGTPTGVPYPVEAAGTLREPGRWSKQSSASLAMGYEIAVTPLQLAAAYVALANDGELLEPALVREVRAPDGRVVYRHERRPLRRVLSPAVARRVREMLRGVVEGGGTAGKADLGNFSLAGKTGTPRRTVNGRYAGGHIPTFVGLFPADNPQFVILVKIDNPQGQYYGGLTAAPVTKAVLEAALASRNASLDRGTLATSRVERAPDTLTLAAARRESTLVASSMPAEPVRRNAVASPVISAGAPAPFVTILNGATPVEPARAPRAVPDVHGLGVRDAVRTLHAAGFHVQLVGGPAGATIPTTGTIAPAGAVVRLSAQP